MKLVSLFILWCLGFLLIVLLCIQFNVSIIENDLTQKTRQALANKGFAAVKSTANGQIITLKGRTISNEDRLQAESVTTTIDGVIAVNNQLTVTTLKSTHNKNNDTVVTKTTKPTQLVPDSQPTGTYPPPQMQTPLSNQPNKPIESNTFSDFSNTTPHVRPMPWPNNTNNVMPFWGSNTMPWGNHFPMNPWGNNGFMPYPFIPYNNMPFSNAFEFPLAPQAPQAPQVPIAPISPIAPFETWMSR